MPLWLTIKDFIIYINMFKMVSPVISFSLVKTICVGVHQAFGEEFGEPVNPQYRTVQMEDSDEDEVPNESKWNQTEVLPTPFSPNFGKKTNNEIQNIAR